LERLITEIKRLDLLVLDEWGYVPVDKEGSQLLFRVISDSYESKSLILTTNLEFSKWGGIFTDQQMAAAMIDRLIHHGHLLVFEGNSYRMEHALMRKTAAQHGSGAGKEASDGR
jgi:DNA replication protein DnaC